jgi:hypothetical protein
MRIVDYGGVSLAGLRMNQKQLEKSSVPEINPGSPPSETLVAPHVMLFAAIGCVAIATTKFTRLKWAP